MDMILWFITIFFVFDIKFAFGVIYAHEILTNIIS